MPYYFSLNGHGCLACPLGRQRDPDKDPVQGQCRGERDTDTIPVSHHGGVSWPSGRSVVERRNVNCNTADSIYAGFGFNA